MFDLAQIGKAFLILFAVIDIVGGIPLILQVRQKAGKIYPARATIVSLAIMVTFLFLGETIFLGVKLFREDLSAPGLTQGDDDHKVFSIVPLAFPVIAGAGTITTILSLRAEFDRANILVAILLNMIPVVLVLLLTNRIERLLGRVGLIIIKKAFGIILLAIAVKLFAGNITQLFPHEP
jgi:multiple antibiotic resistance protein